MAQEITHGVDTGRHQRQYEDEQADDGVPLAQCVRPQARKR